MSAQEIVVEHPAFSIRKNDFFEIERVVINEMSTTLYIKGFQTFGLVSVDPDIYLNVGGKEYLLQHAENIEFGKRVEDAYKNGEFSFSLVFLPVPAETERFDLCTRTKEWMIWDVELKRTETPSTAYIPAQFIQAAKMTDDGKPLEAPQWKEADAILKGYIAGYKPEMNLWIEIMPVNIITGVRRESYLADVNADGTFVLSVPMLVTQQVQLIIVPTNKDKIKYSDIFGMRTPAEKEEDRKNFSNRIGNANIDKILAETLVLLSPGEETHICFDLNAHFRKKAQLRHDRQSNPKIFYFAGANAEINNQYFDVDYESYRSKIWASVGNQIHINDTILPTVGIRFIPGEISEMTQSEYKERILKARDECIADINNNPTLTTKTKQFFKTSLYYETAHQLQGIRTRLGTSERISTDNNREVFRFDPFELSDIEYYSFLNDLPLNDPVSLYFQKYYEVIRGSRYISINKERRSVAEVLGTSKGMFFDLMKCHVISDKKYWFWYQPLTNEDLELEKKFKDTYFGQQLTGLHDDRPTTFELNNLGGNHRINDVRDIEADELYEAIVGEEKDRVVLVKFWATWCGTCRYARTQFEPYKFKYGPDRVRFVYITNELSPLDAWQTTIPELSGEHYRLTNNQYDYIKKRLGVNFDSLPSYVVLDKNGNKVSSPDYRDVGVFLTEINKAME